MPLNLIWTLRDERRNRPSPWVGVAVGIAMSLSAAAAHALFIKIDDLREDTIAYFDDLDPSLPPVTSDTEFLVVNRIPLVGRVAREFRAVIYMIEPRLLDTDPAVLSDRVDLRFFPDPGDLKNSLVDLQFRSDPFVDVPPCTPHPIEETGVYQRLTNRFEDPKTCEAVTLPAGFQIEVRSDIPEPSLPGLLALALALALGAVAWSRRRLASFG